MSEEECKHKNVAKMPYNKNIYGVCDDCKLPLKAKSFKWEELPVNSSLKNCWKN
jgi:hypothetical protein